MSRAKYEILRPRAGEHAGRVSFVELFFDLVFVFTIVQLSHTLAHHYTPLGLFEGAMLVLAVWWVWMFTTWVMNWLQPECMTVRILLFVLMFLGLILSTSIPQAFADRGLAFALAFATMQVGRSAFMIWATRGNDDGNYRNFLRITAWLAVSGVFWIAGGIAHHEWRIGLWLVALAIEYASPAAGFWTPGLGGSTTADWKISGEHMAERCALFVIICLGETILVSGRLFTEGALTAATLSAFAVAFTTTVLLWWIYFRFGHRHAAHLIEHSENPGREGRLAYTYGHIPIVAGIILTAVRTDFLLAHPLETASAKTASAIIGGPMVFLLGNLGFKGIVAGRVPLSHGVGLIALLAVGAPAAFMPNLALAGLSALVLLGVAHWEWRSLHHAEHDHAA